MFTCILDTPTEHRLEGIFFMLVELNYKKEGKREGGREKEKETEKKRGKEEGGKERESTKRVSIREYQ